MKLTPKLKHFLNKQCQFYCYQLGIQRNVKLIYTKSQVNAAMKEVATKERNKINPPDNDAITIYDEQDAIIYVNYKDVDLVTDLIDSLVHELLHMKDTKLRHGKKFQDMINDIIMSNY